MPARSVRPPSPEKGLRAAFLAWVARQPPEAMARLETEVRWFRALSDADFGGLPNQEILWRMPLGAAGLPSAEPVDVAVLSTDPATVGALRALRALRETPEGPEEEIGDRIIAAWDHLCRCVRRHVRDLPLQRLARIAVMLLPDRLGLPWPVGDSAACIRNMLARRRRLQQAIGPGRGLRDQLCRALFLAGADIPDAPPADAPPAPLLTDLPEPFYCPADRLIAALRSDPGAAGFVWDDDQLRMLHAAWNLRRRFVILAGTPGIGKTALLSRYARAFCRALGHDPQAQIRLLAVAPDWQDPGSLLGWLQPLAARPAWVPGPALSILQLALRWPERPFFLLLDELNLARVERYLAPVLSSLESGEPLLLHSHPKPVDGVPPSIPWPPNLFLGGTLNMDESTHALSDRVLDRAFLLELRDADLRAWMERRAALGRPVDPAAGALIVDLQAILAGAGLGFAFRTAEEVADFVREAAGLGVDRAAALDAAIRSRVLVRIRGVESAGLVGALERAKERLEGEGLKGSAGVVEGMIGRMRVRGVTGYWG